MSVPLGTIALGHRGRLRIAWHPEGDDRSSVPSLELAREKLGDDGAWHFVGATVVRASCNVRELANAVDAAARFAERWCQEHPGER